jgi:hypothetical protein
VKPFGNGNRHGGDKSPSRSGGLSSGYRWFDSISPQNVAASDEDEEVAAAFADGAGELAAGLGGGADGEQPVEPAVEVGTVLGEGGVLQLRAPLADGGGAAQEFLEAQCETGVAGIDGVLGVAQQVRQTTLAFVAMPGLRRIAVGNPPRPSF